MNTKEWTCIKATSPREYLDELCAVMSMSENSLQIEDYSDVEQELDGVYGDLIDESLLKADKTVVSVSVYLSADRDAVAEEAEVRRMLTAAGIPAEVCTYVVNEDDWADCWKKYYHPIKTGKKIVIVPVWEEYTPAEGETVVLMDPGMAFGTGTHETTRLCAALLEQYVKSGDSMLDVGCGSGILAICAAKLGAEKCFACDIDPAAVRIAGENAVLNGVEDTVTSAMSDLLADVPAGERYNVVCANIVADIIIRMSGDVDKFVADGGVVLVSGIILERCAEVRDAMTAAGFKEDSFLEENGWYAGAWVRG